MRCFLSMFLILLFPWNSVLAEYEVTGNVEGQVCRGFVIESCQLVEIVAVEGEDGELHEIAKKYVDVDEYRERDGLCWINTTSRGAGLFSSAANLLFGTRFFTLTENGKYEEVAIEYLVFGCRKT